MELIYIDDDDANRAVMREMLATAGITMAEAADAISGLEAIDRHDYDVVLMDLRMPQMDGAAATSASSPSSDSTSSTFWSGNRTSWPWP